MPNRILSSSVSKIVKGERNGNVENLFSKIAIAEPHPIFECVKDSELMINFMLIKHKNHIINKIVCKSNGPNGAKD